MAEAPNTITAFERAPIPHVDLWLAAADALVVLATWELKETTRLAEVQHHQLVARGQAHEAPTTETPPHLHFFDIPAREEALRVATQLVEDVERIMNMKPP